METLSGTFGSSLPARLDLIDVKGSALLRLTRIRLTAVGRRDAGPVH